MGDWPLSFRIITVDADKDVSAYQGSSWRDHRAQPGHEMAGSYSDGGGTADHAATAHVPGRKDCLWQGGAGLLHVCNPDLMMPTGLKAIACEKGEGSWLDLAALNAVSIQPCEIAAGQVLLSDHPHANIALAARLSALQVWREAQGHPLDFDPAAVAEAAARSDLKEIEAAVGFDPGAFAAIVHFIEELPW